MGCGPDLPDIAGAEEQLVFRSPYRSMEVPRLSGNPAQEFRYSFMRKKRRTISACSRQLGIAEMRMDNPVTDWVDGNRLASALGFGDRVVMLDLAAQRALT